MKHFYTYIFTLILVSTSTFASNGTTQKHLLNIQPQVTEVNATSSFVLTFDMAILETSIKKNTIVLKQKKPTKQKISGNVILGTHTLTFAPSAPLEKGIYLLKIKPLKLVKEGENKLQVKTPWQKFIAWTCGLFYKDISKCPMCQYFCYTSNVTYTKPIKFRFEVKEAAPKVMTLDASVTLVELSEYNSTSISVMVNYEDNSTEDVTQKATYASNDSPVDADKGIITSNAEGSATVTISYGGKTTTVQVEVYEMIEGHLLPHKPNNPDATLLGVDKNANGVRDEVERWIYKDMPTYHHPEIERVIAMQQAKAFQMALIDPTNKDDKIDKAITRGIACWFYYSDFKDIPFDAAVQKFNNNLKDKQFNTKKRLKTYLDYDYTLKGAVTIAIPASTLNTSYCDKNIDELP